jgi:peroxiredoxin Q/BCP
MLDKGDAAPEISARNQDDETVTPAFEEPTVVYFYPRDGTPGCTLEAQQFRDHHDAFGLPVRDGFVERVTFVLAGGEVTAVVDADNVNPDGHAADVLDAVEAAA